MSTVKGLRDVIRVNYSDLSNLVGSSSLVPGQEYLIQDFRLKHDLCNTSDSYTSTVTEELIVKAVSNNAIGTEAKSTLHPADLIEYSLENMYGSDRGFILRRTDTIKNVTANFDFRYYKVALRQINQTTHANGNFSCNKGTIVCKTGTNELYYKISNEIGYFDSTLNVGTIKHVWELLPFQNLGYYNLMSGISYSTNYISSSVFTDNFGDNIYDDYTLSNVELVADLGDGKIPVIVTGDSEIINSTIKNCCYIDSLTINNSVIDNCNYIKCTEITRSTLKVGITRGLSDITDCNIEYLNFLYVNYCQNNIIKDTSYSSIVIVKNYLRDNRINLSRSVINSQCSSVIVSGKVSENRIELMKDSYYYGVDEEFDRNLVSGKIENSTFFGDFIENEIRDMRECQVDLEQFIGNKINTIISSYLGSNHFGIISHNEIENVNSLYFYDECYLTNNKIKDIYNTTIQNYCSINYNTIREISLSDFYNVSAENNIVDIISESELIADGGITQISFFGNKINDMYQSQINCEKFECNTIENTFVSNTVEGNFCCNTIKGVFSNNTVLNFFGKNYKESKDIEHAGGNLVLSDFYYTTIEGECYGNIFRGPVGVDYEENLSPDYGNVFVGVHNSEIIGTVIASNITCVSSKVGSIRHSKVSLYSSEIEYMTYSNYEGTYELRITDCKIKEIVRITCLLNHFTMEKVSGIILSDFTSEKIDFLNCTGLNIFSTKFKSSTWKVLNNIDFSRKQLQLGSSPGVDFSSSTIAIAGYDKKVIVTPNGTIKMYYHDDLTLAPVYVELNA